MVRHHYCQLASTLHLAVTEQEWKNAMEWPDRKETFLFFYFLADESLLKTLYNDRGIQIQFPPPSSYTKPVEQFLHTASAACCERHCSTEDIWGKAAHLPFLPTKVARYPCPSESWTFSVISCSWNIDCRPRTVAETSAKQREGQQIYLTSNKDHLLTEKKTDLKPILLHAAQLICIFKCFLNYLKV